MPTKSWSSPTSNISKNTTIKLPSAICSDSGSDKQQQQQKQKQKQHASRVVTAHPWGVGISCPSRRRRRQRRRPTHAAGRPVRTTNGFQVLSQSTPGLARQRPMLKRGEHDTEKMPGRALTDDRWMILAMVSRFNPSRKRPKTRKVNIHRWCQSNSATAKTFDVHFRQSKLRVAQTSLFTVRQHPVYEPRHAQACHARHRGGKYRRDKHQLKSKL